MSKRVQSHNSASATALAVSQDKELRVPCYCEENVWRLAHRKLKQPLASSRQYYVVFVSNRSKCVCFFHQRASENPIKPVFWDYHVILLERDTVTQQTMVLDVDSYLPYPFSLSKYLDHSFPEEKSEDPLHQIRLDRVAPFFRLVSAQTFLQNFRSDRSHMWNEAEQRWSAPPPTYDCIQGMNETDDNQLKTNLMTYVDMLGNLDDSKYGKVYSRQQLRDEFC